MRILITNDDGIYSPGIAALARAAQRFGEVRVVAPDVEMSSAAHAITASRPLSYRRTPLDGIDAWRVNGTPADCVALGVFHWDKVDVVLSGINIGSNLGNGIWHSGTLAGAKQAALIGLRGYALSTPSTDGEPKFDVLTPWVVKVLEYLLPEEDLALVNVNLPTGQPRGVLWTRQSVREYDGKIVPATDPMGRKHFWFTVIPVENIDKNTDRWAIDRGYVSMTPLRVDLTDDKEYVEAEIRRPLGAITFAGRKTPPKGKKALAKYSRKARQKVKQAMRERRRRK